MTEQAFIYLGVLGFVALFALVIRLAVVQRRREVERLRRLGFFEVADPDRALLERLVEVMRVSPKKSHSGTLFRRSAGFYEMYTFLPRPSEGGGMEFVVRVPGMDLPRIRLMRRVHLTGMFGRWVNSLIAQLGGMGLGTVDLTRHPDLAEKYFIFADNAAAAEQLVGDTWRSLLIEAPEGFALSGAGDILAFGFDLNIRVKRQRSRALPTVPGMPTAEDQRFSDCARRMERFVETVRATAEHAHRPGR